LIEKTEQIYATNHYQFWWLCMVKC
jgi:hypothetical protein